MAHRTSRSGYLDLVNRLNRHPQGAPPSKLLFRILEMLFSERDAELAALLPIKQAMASRQMKSRYLETLLQRTGR